MKTPMRFLFALSATLALTFHASAATRIWTGAVDNLWSTSGNWSDGIVPVAGDQLTFSQPASHKTNTNDLEPGLMLQSITIETAGDFSGGEYVIGGNTIGLTTELRVAGARPATINAALRLGGPLTTKSLNPTTFNGAIDLNGFDLTIAGDGYTHLNGVISGSGNVIVTGLATMTADNTYAGITNCGLCVISGSQPQSDVTIVPDHFSGLMRLVGGGGSVGNVTVQGILQPGGMSGRGRLLTKNLAFTDDSWFLYIGIDGPTPGSGYDQVRVTGTVTIASRTTMGTPSLSHDYFPSPGQVFTLIDNDGIDPVIGTFGNQPEGAVMMSNGVPFRISYHGGDGNDVVLTVLADTSAALTQDVSTTKVGENWTLTATVASQFGVPTGSVTFSLNGVVAGTAPTVNGVASLTVSPFTAGSRNVSAAFRGTGAFGDSVSGSVVHVVTPGQTTTSIAANQPNTTYGQTAHFTVTVVAQAPAAGQPAGSVTILADGATLGTAPIVNGTGIFETSALHAGVRSITAAYGGDANFAASSASTIQQNVGKGQTEVDARSRTAFVGESPLITVFVNVTPGSSLAPTGSVTLSEGGAVVGAQTLAGGAASFSIGPLAVGDHTFVVSYSGDTDFVASSATIVQSVVAPSVSIQGARVIEGNHGVSSVSLSVTLSAPVSQPVRVSFSTVAGSAIEVEDYDRASGVIEFAPGELTRSIELHVIGDTFPEPDESFSVLLSNPINATIDTASAVIVIANDDQVPPRHRPSRH